MDVEDYSYIKMESDTMQYDEPTLHSSSTISLSFIFYNLGASVVMSVVALLIIQGLNDYIIDAYQDASSFTYVRRFPTIYFVAIMCVPIGPTILVIMEWLLLKSYRARGGILLWGSVLTVSLYISIRWLYSALYTDGAYPDLPEIYFWVLPVVPTIFLVSAAGLYVAHRIQVHNREKQAQQKSKKN